MTVATILAQDLGMRGLAKPRHANLVDKIAKANDVEPAVVDAIISVESRDAYDPDGLLILLPEKHKLYQDLARRANDRTAHTAALAGLASKSPSYAGLTSYAKNPGRAAQQRWQWVSDVAERFGPEFAFRNASWGSPQIMGFNCKLAGYDTAEMMVRDFADAEEKQLAAMFAYFKATGLMPALRTRDWRRIARLYNGPAYIKHNYHGRLSEAYANSPKKRSGISHSDEGIIALGHSGPHVKDLQQQLVALGYNLIPDGDFGQETEDAVAAFQRRNHIVVDGIVGEQTREAITMAYPKDPNNTRITEVIRQQKSAQSAVGVIATSATSLVIGVGKAVESASTDPVEAIKTANEVGGSAIDAVGNGIKVFSLLANNATLIFGAAGLAFGCYVLYRVWFAVRNRITA